MKKFKSKCGYIVYETTPKECILITGGFGICDMCAKTDKKIFLVPVLNHALCIKCFETWNERAVFYKEDLPFERVFQDIYEKNAKQVGLEVVEDER